MCWHGPIAHPTSLSREIWYDQSPYLLGFKAMCVTCWLVWCMDICGSRGTKAYSFLASARGLGYRAMPPYLRSWDHRFLEWNWISLSSLKISPPTSSMQAGGQWPRPSIFALKRFGMVNVSLCLRRSTWPLPNKVLPAAFTWRECFH